MLVKVCGMRERDNIEQVVALGIDMMGFIYYPKSPRYVGESFQPKAAGVARVGVFVNEEYERITEVATTAGLTHIQLHGAESRELCQRLRGDGLKVIKALSIAQQSDFDLTAQYEGSVDILLFDTKCSGYGGSGASFDWSLLANYRGKTPFMLSGGISEDSAEEIAALDHPMLVGVDLNSRFEIEPALKDVTKLKKFIEKLR